MPRMGIAIFKSSKRKPPRDVWQEFLGDAKLLKEHHITDEEMEILKDFSPLGVVTCIGDILFILSTIRWGRDKKRGS